MGCSAHFPWLLPEGHPHPLLPAGAQPQEPPVPSHLRPPSLGLSLPVMKAGLWR